MAYAECLVLVVSDIYYISFVLYHQQEPLAVLASDLVLAPDRDLGGYGVRFTNDMRLLDRQLHNSNSVPHIGTVYR